jgi:signal transduction histidine kinase
VTWVRGLTIATVSLAVLGLALAVASLVIEPSAVAAAQLAVVAVISIACLALGGLIAYLQPHNAVAPLLAVAGVILPTDDLVAPALSAIVGQPAVDAMASASEGLWVLLYLPFALLMLVFPDGHLDGRGPRLVAAGLVSTAASFGLLDSGAFDSPPVWAAVSLLVLFLAFLVACVVVVRRRYHSSDAVVRVQIRWLMLAATSIPLTLLLCWTSYLLLGGADLVVIGLVFMYVAFPAATAVAILRHDLYDVDRALVATSVYAVLAVILLGVFSAVSALAGLAVGRDSTVIAVAVTAVCALAVSPVRARLERSVRRRLTPERERTLAAIERLQRDVHAGRAQPEALETVLRGALDDPGLRVGLRVPGRDGLVDVAGTVFTADDRSTSIDLAGQSIGIIAPGPDSGKRPPKDVAEAAALLAEMIRLRRVLSDAVAEVEASRSRILRAGYDERRRLEQDLHDGAQQRLVTLGMGLRVAQRHLMPEMSATSELLDHAVAEIGTAVAELRQIAHGLRPSSLDDGLAAALANLSAMAPMPIDIAFDADELADDLGTTAYFVASEAVANAVKYANADHIALRVTQNDGVVRVTVTDDGCGGAAVRPGAGLARLTDRVCAMGGRLQVASADHGGTTVEAVLPCGS